MANPALAEAGRFALSVPVRLIHYSGAVSTTRGVIGRLPQSETQLEAPFDDESVCCWAAPIGRAERVEYLEAGERRWRVNDVEPITGAVFGSVNYGSVRYMLIQETVAPDARVGDFDPADWSSEDFDTGDAA